MDNSFFNSTKALAVITGASSGVGYELAKMFAKKGFDLLVVAEDRGIIEAGNAFSSLGAQVETFQADLSSFEGVELTCAKIKSLGKPVEVIAMNAGFRAGGEFVNTNLAKELKMIGLNNASLVHMTKRLLPDLIKQGHGRILFASSIASSVHGSHYAVYAATKAFVQSFSEAIRAEVQDKGITVTTLQPGPPDTKSYEHAML